MKPLVSILIPAYNAEPWIAQTLKSALAQTWPCKEIIVVDDGSTDKTLTVALTFASPQVKVVAQKNAGASAARNHAYRLCSGKYIQWLDADDILDPDKITQQMDMAESLADKWMLLSSASARFYFRLSYAQWSPTVLWKDLTPYEWLVRKMGQNLHMATGTWLVSRELTDAAGQWDERLTLDDDGEYFCRVLLASHGVKFVPDARWYYRISGTGGLSNVDHSSKKLESLWDSMQLHIKYLRQMEDSERTRAACVFYLGTWVNYFHPARPDLIGEIKQLAATLGGKLDLAPVRPKYAWIEKSFGYDAAHRAQTMLPNLKSSALRAWDKLMYRLGG
jgi:glycosyltransferase involved in cell wall biosynthesis